jgi:hypothetical protein
MTMSHYLLKVQVTRCLGVAFLSCTLGGPDNITRVLKELATHIAPILTIIFLCSYQTSEVPATCTWKSANICPVYKKGKLLPDT